MTHACTAAARRRSREFALQGLYEWLLSGEPPDVVSAHVREQDGFDRCDASHFEMLLRGCIAEAAPIDAALPDTGAHADASNDRYSGLPADPAAYVKRVNALLV